MKNLFAQHISEIGENKQHIKKFAKGNVVPQTRMSIDASATKYNIGDIGVGREDFWIIKEDKNKRKSWRPLRLESIFSDLQDKSTQWIFWGEGRIVFELNKKFEKNYSPTFNVSIHNTANGLKLSALWKDYKLTDYLSVKDLWESFSKDLQNYLGTQKIDVSTIIADKRENGDDYIPRVYKTPTQALVWEIALLLERVVQIQNKANQTKYWSNLDYDDIQDVAKRIESNLQNNQSTPQSNTSKSVDEILNEYFVKFKDNPIIENLPTYLKKMALKQMNVDGGSSETELSGAFDFGISQQGMVFWWNVMEGNWGDVVKALNITKEDLLKDVESNVETPASQTQNVKPKVDSKPLEETPKSPISIDIKTLEEEYNDVMFLIDVTPKVDVVALTELKQRAYDLKKQINEKHLERTDVMLSENNIFFKLFESSSVEPIFRYNLTPDPNEFAPDGTPTTLPKSIYELCQTPDFISWFGDYRSAYNYRNSPYSEVPCSVVKTEHYEPMIVFHGTGSEFSYFDFNQFPAMYFAQNFSYAEWFAEQKGAQNGTIGYVYPFLLNIRNYLDLTEFGIDEISYEDFADAIFLQTGLEPDELKISQALIQNKAKVWAWVYLRNSPEFLKTLRDLKLFDGIIYYEQNPPINPTAPNYMTKGFIIFEPQNAKIVAPNRKELLLPSMRSFYLKKGGKL
jgi:L-lactate utilization protein LutC